jgi:hypothetical protein
MVIDPGPVLAAAKTLFDILSKLDTITKYARQNTVLSPLQMVAVYKSIKRLKALVDGVVSKSLSGEDYWRQLETEIADVQKELSRIDKDVLQIFGPGVPDAMAAATLSEVLILKESAAFKERHLIDESESIGFYFSFNEMRSTQADLLPVLSDRLDTLAAKIGEFIAANWKIKDLSSF